MPGIPGTARLLLYIYILGIYYILLISTINYYLLVVTIYIMLVY